MQIFSNLCGLCGYVGYVVGWVGRYVGFVGQKVVWVKGVKWFIKFQNGSKIQHVPKISCMQELELYFSDFLEVFMHSRKCPPKNEQAKLSPKSSRFVSRNHFENGLISNMSEQRSFNCWLETDLISDSNN